MEITSNENINPLEALIASVAVGVVLFACGVSIHRALWREHDAMAAASLMGTRAALEHYAAVKGEYPEASTVINLSNGCVDSEGGVYSKAGRGNCTATLFAVTNQADIFYKSSTDRKGYALSVQENSQPKGVVLCGTPRSLERTAQCLPVNRSVAQ